MGGGGLAGGAEDLSLGWPHGTQLSGAVDGSVALGARLAAQDII